MAEAADDEVQETEPADEESAEFVELFSGAALGSKETGAITTRSRTHLVVFAGAEGSGKTTLVTSIYERLSDGPFAGFKFAGSRSLLGFEEICHLNRLASGATQPDTQRTRLTPDTKYYHLSLRPAETPVERREVLLSAMSGELFRMARDSKEDTQRLTFLRRADTLVVLVDGQRLSTKASRTNAQADAADILESVLDTNMIGSNCRVEIAFSKLDCITEAGQAAIDFAERAQTKLEGRFRERVPGISFCCIAARPNTPLIPSDGGLAAAFSSWMTAASPRDDHQGARPTRLPATREFTKFGWRHELSRKLT